MKKTCLGCRALNTSFGSCYLGYAVDANYHPTENCPKPKTYKELCMAPRKYCSITPL